MSSEESFKGRVEALIAAVPAGKVTTYGDLAAIAGQAAASRIVGAIAHYGSSDLPWHRLVNRFGGLARGYPGGMDAQRRHLEAEGVAVADYKVVDFEVTRWKPSL